MNILAKHNILSSAIRIALLSAVTFSLPAAYAAEEDAEEGAEETQERKMVVTGSRIRKDAFANDTPIDVITIEDAEIEGLKSLGELLRTSTAAAGSNQLTAALGVGFVVNGGTGAESISLRGLGANRTLVLLNGRRAGPAGTRGAVSAFDLNSLPLSTIERVEVLKDGASSLYGSDAVAGVINIITKKGSDKTFTFDTSQPFEDGGDDTRMNMSYGEEFTDGSFRVTADFRKQTMVRRGDRDYLACEERLLFREDGSLADPIDPRTGEPHCQGRGFGLWLYGPISSAYGGSLQAAFDYDGFFAANGYESFNDVSATTGFTTPTGWYPVSFNNNRDSEGWWDLQHPFLERTTLVPETTNSSFYATGEYNVAENITAYGEFIYSSRTTKTDANRQFWTNEVGPQPANNIGGGFSGAGFIMPVALTDHFSSEINVDYTRLVLGLNGALGDWEWDVSYQSSDNDGEYINDIILADSHLMSQINWATGTGCTVGQVTPISGNNCADVNWADPNFLYGNLTAEQKAFLFGVDVGNTTYKQQTFEAFITGDLFSMPAGEVGSAFGIQFQEDEIDDVPGEQTLAGNSWGLSSAGRTAGKQKTNAVFGEINIPLLEGLVGAKAVDFTASARYTDVDTYGSDTTFKAHLSWEIVDGLTVRGSRGTSFRAPALYELYLGDQTGYGGQLAIDPCLDYVAEYAAGAITETVFLNCQAHNVPASYTAPGSSVLLVTSGGAGRLSAETSVAETGGFVWVSPEDTFAFSADYYQFELKGEVANLGGANIVNQCYNTPTANFANEPLCDLFVRRTGGATGTDFGIDRVNGGYVNIATQTVRGIDYNFTYQDEFDFGKIRLSIEHTNQLEKTRLLFADSTYNNNIGENNYPKHAGNMRLTWTGDEYSVTWTTTYFSSTNDYEYYTQPKGGTTWDGEAVTRIDETPWTYYHTVSTSTSLFDNLNIIVGIANVFDEEPPILSSSGNEVGNAARYSRFDFIGQRLFANFKYSF
ncbi:MAG: TonB-dependent receptor [Gammaproteobacteria bacterium]|nr:TonB-dependent receptor [Gammaproteobacteria bacterium]